MTESTAKRPSMLAWTAGPLIVLLAGLSLWHAPVLEAFLVLAMETAGRFAACF